MRASPLRGVHQVLSPIGSVHIIRLCIFAYIRRARRVNGRCLYCLSSPFIIRSHDDYQVSTEFLSSDYMSEVELKIEHPFLLAPFPLAPWQSSGYELSTKSYVNAEPISTMHAWKCLGRSLSGCVSMLCFHY